MFKVSEATLPRGGGGESAIWCGLDKSGNFRKLIKVLLRAILNIDNQLKVKSESDGHQTTHKNAPVLHSCGSGGGSGPSTPQLFALTPQSRLLYVPETFKFL